MQYVLLAFIIGGIIYGFARAVYEDKHPPAVKSIAVRGHERAAAAITRMEAKGYKLEDEQRSSTGKTVLRFRHVV